MWLSLKVKVNSTVDFWHWFLVCCCCVGIASPGSIIVPAQLHGLCHGCCQSLSLLPGTVKSIQH
jgi:hypothetical protein